MHTGLPLHRCHCHVNIRYLFSVITPFPFSSSPNLCPNPLTILKEVGGNIPSFIIHRVLVKKWENVKLLFCVTVKAEEKEECTDEERGIENLLQ